MTVTTLPTAHTAPPVVETPVARRASTAYTPAPAGTSAELPRVFAVIHGVMRDVMPVGKDKQNQQQNYYFRGVDDAMSAMAGPMRNHGCFIAPEVVEHKQRPRGEKGTHTVITMLYRIYGPAGDCLAVTIPGEAMDTADKSTNKAMSAALKYMLFQVFMIPVDARSIDDGDRDHPVMTNAPQQRQQQPQQRRQQPQQQRGQRQQQRRPQQDQAHGQEQPQQRRRRDYAAEARKATSEEEFAAIRKAADAAGAPPEYITQLDAIAAEKRAAARGPQSTPPAGPPPEQAPAGAPPVPAVATAPPSGNPTTAAEEALRIAASRAHLITLDADFERVYGIPIAQATAVQLHAFRKKIEGTAA
ncbi:ERF family protein [Streptomyces sp. NBC_00572]|uniref:ERF family protein n=1 Tax=Streptomyces sp. NBC_00572 TaxID=2903664 RepID=UPI002251A75B|nr:ERF family protein [Streptomyces sp. NBC_00572]MCX4987154.1 ERF family protein [Streptomyces sp. NBC_00572]